MLFLYLFWFIILLILSRLLLYEIGILTKKKKYYIREFFKTDPPIKINSPEFRALISLALLAALCFCTYYFHVQENITLIDLAKFFITGLVVISIFYSILGFEFSVKKTKEDDRHKKTQLTFTSISDWHKDTFIGHIEMIRKFENSGDYQNLMETGILKSFAEEFLSFINQPKQVELKKSSTAIFNYFENIAAAVEEKVMDEQYLRRYFEQIFTRFYNDWIYYIRIRQEKEGDLGLWCDFITLVERWQGFSKDPWPNFKDSVN